MKHAIAPLLLLFAALPACRCSHTEVVAVDDAGSVYEAEPPLKPGEESYYGCRTAEISRYTAFQPYSPAREGVPAGMVFEVGNCNGFNGASKHWLIDEQGEVWDHDGRRDVYLNIGRIDGAVFDGVKMLSLRIVATKLIDGESSCFDCGVSSILYRAAGREAVEIANGGEITQLRAHPKACTVVRWILALTYEVTQAQLRRLRDAK